MVQLIYSAFFVALHRKRQRGEPASRWLAWAIDVPWVSVLSGAFALVAWPLWLVHAESARRRTHAVVEGFGLSLHREPWPLGAAPLLSAVLLPTLAALFVAAVARARIQRRVLAGGVPFPPGAGGGRSAAPVRYFAGTGVAAAATWALHAWLVALLVGSGVWAASMASVHAASKAVRPSFGVAPATSPASRLLSGAEADAPSADGALASAAAATGSAAASQAPSPLTGWERSGWMPDFPGPGRFCPPTCVDLSAFSYYLGDETCSCNVVGGVFAAEPHAAAALRHLLPAIASLAALWAAMSWLLLAAGCHFAHTESEELLVSGGLPDGVHGTGAAATAAAEATWGGEEVASAGAAARHPAVRALSERLLCWMGGARGGRVQGAVPNPTEPLLPQLGP